MVCQTLISYCEWNLVFACMRRKHLSVQCRTIMSNWQIFGSGQFFNINKVFFWSLCAFTRIFLIHIAIPIKKWWITFSWLAESTTHWDQTILKIHILNSCKNGCLWWPLFCPMGMVVIVYGSYLQWHIVILIKKWWITFSWLLQSTTHDLLIRTLISVFKVLKNQSLLQTST